LGRILLGEDPPWNKDPPGKIPAREDPPGRRSSEDLGIGSVIGSFQDLER
jgi:hypothetical protein